MSSSQLVSKEAVCLLKPLTEHWSEWFCDVNMKGRQGWAVLLYMNLADFFLPDTRGAQFKKASFDEVEDWFWAR